jgi:hypothetical protein
LLALFSSISTGKLVPLIPPGHANAKHICDAVDSIGLSANDEEVATAAV